MNPIFETSCDAVLLLILFQIRDQLTCEAEGRKAGKRLLHLKIDGKTVVRIATQPHEGQATTG
jgi:hypothetical protein